MHTYLWKMNSITMWDFKSTQYLLSRCWFPKRAQHDLISLCFELYDVPLSTLCHVLFIWSPFILIYCSIVVRMITAWCTEPAWYTERAWHEQINLTMWRNFLSSMRMKILRTGSFIYQQDQLQRSYSACMTREARIYKWRANPDLIFLRVFICPYDNSSPERIEGKTP